MRINRKIDREGQINEYIFNIENMVETFNFRNKKDDKHSEGYYQIKFELNDAAFILKEIQNILNNICRIKSKANNTEYAAEFFLEKACFLINTAFPKAKSENRYSLLNQFGELTNSIVKLGFQNILSDLLTIELFKNYPMEILFLIISKKKNKSSINHIEYADDESLKLFAISLNKHLYTKDIDFGFSVEVFKFSILIEKITEIEDIDRRNKIFKTIMDENKFIFPFVFNRIKENELILQVFTEMIVKSEKYHSIFDFITENEFVNFKFSNKNQYDELMYFDEFIRKTNLYWSLSDKFDATRKTEKKPKI